MASKTESRCRSKSASWATSSRGCLDLAALMVKAAAAAEDCTMGCILWLVKMLLTVNK
eukprot:CAMPEP_0113679310 /NCGR_PEP_ID=MMETSP0038_2-20120614/10540_1 /TAXON_ID=2898 /ORGANISM="Cryptomonas paramecium" /LENGTH=57 /DNA_ID=CAMNT_0000597261 /DNA_START=191 /DNA_END=364 /DNA_ORIENTATION=- /assembly_acc=CAM_ASM_000170